MKKPCLTCGVPSEESWCPAHKPLRKRPNGRYSYAWRKASREARQAQPFCSVAGCNSSDLTADHVIPMARGGAKVPDASLIVVLCRKHNSSKGAR